MAKYAAVVAVGCALAYGLGIPDYGLSARVLPQLVAVFLGMGLAALGMGFGRLANISFAIGGLAAFVVMQSTSATTDEVQPPGSEPLAASLEVEQYSTANLTGADSSAFDVLTSSRADIIAVQGLTPDWARALSTRLAPGFPAQYLYPDIGVGGLGLFSRLPLEDVDTLLVGGVVQVRACHPLPGAPEGIEVYAVQTLPPLSRQTSLGLQAQLDRVSEALLLDDRPVVLIGDLNAVPWSPIVNRFTARAGLRDSRRSELPSYEAGMPGLFETPVEHILYSHELRCVRFETVRSAGATYLGNRASFRPADAAAGVVAL